MAEDINNITLIGRLTKDPELKFTPGKGTAVCTFNLAVNRRQSKSGNGQQQTADFIPIVVWGKAAESVANYMSKGRQICIIGRLQIRSYTDKSGNKKFATEVIANTCEFLGSRNENGNSQRSQNRQNNSYNNYNQSQNQDPNSQQDDFGDDITPIDDGDIPF